MVKTSSLGGVRKSRRKTAVTPQMVKGLDLLRRRGKWSSQVVLFSVTGLVCASFLSTPAFPKDVGHCLPSLDSGSSFPGSLTDSGTQLEFPRLPWSSAPCCSISWVWGGCRQLATELLQANPISLLLTAQGTAFADCTFLSAGL